MSEPHPIVVLIEDEPQIRRLLRTVLPTHGIELFEAETGYEGLVEVGTRRPDVVILDLGLPDIGGVEVVKRLREWSEVPVIILSARTRRSGQDRRARCRRRRLPDQTLRRRRVARAACGWRCGARHRTSDGDQVFAVGPITVDLARAASNATARRCI